jgi:hypothetical protein
LGGPDNNAVFDANGKQINPAFGQYNNANGARAGQVGLRYTSDACEIMAFRLNRQAKHLPVAFGMPDYD